MRGFVSSVLALFCVLVTTELTLADDKAMRRVILVTIDTLRADHVGSYGYPRPTTPFIDSLSAGGLRFSQAFTVAPHTAPSHASMFTGLYPFEHTVLRNYDTLPQSVPTLERALQGKGVVVGAFPSVRFLENSVGFTTERDLGGESDRKLRAHWYRNAEENIARVKSFFSKVKPEQSYFVWLHLFDVHQWQGDNNVPASYRKMMQADRNDRWKKHLISQHGYDPAFFKGEEKLWRAIDGYDARLRYVDDQLAGLQRWLEAQKLAEGLTWFITSDHGEGLGNHGYEGHGKYLYHEQLHVPLIVGPVSGSGIAGSSINALVQTVDLYPTILQAMAVMSPEVVTRLPIQGVSFADAFKKGTLTRPVEQQIGYAERRPKDDALLRRDWIEGDVLAVHSAQWKYIHQSRGKDELFDLKTDSRESKSLADTKPEETQRWRQALQRIRGGKKDEATIEKQDLLPEELEELKTLGYL